MALPGYSVAIYAGGTSTTFTGESFTNTSGNIWLIDSVTKTVWDPTLIPTFYDNAVAIDVADIVTIDYMFGKVTFTGVKVGPITADGKYVPVLSLTGGYEVTFSATVADLDSTQFGAAGFKSVTPGLSNLSGSFSLWANPLDDIDPGGGTRKLGTAFTSQTLLMFAIQPNPSSTGSMRTWGYMTKMEPKAGVADLSGYSVDFVSTVIYDSAGRAASFGISL